MNEDQEKLLKELTNKLESLIDTKTSTKEESSELEQNIECLSDIISTFETLHCPITEREKKYSKIIKKLFEL